MSEDVVAGAGDGSFSKEYVEKLKADLAAKEEEAAKLKAFKSSHDAKQRDVIAKMQPEINSFVEGLVKENADYAEDMKPIVEWSRNCHESNSLDTTMPLARMVSCASAQFKRSREEFSVASDKATTLSATMKELEEAKADLASKSQRIAELEGLCNDRQAAAEKLQDELAKAGVLKDKFDFSKLSSREAAPKETDENKDAVPASGLVATTSNASRGVGGGSLEDELLGFVRGSATDGGSHRIRQSATGHSYLGATQGSLEGEIASAFGI